MKNRLKQIRKELGLTQQEFADKLKITRSNIAGYETGSRNPSEAVIALICSIFNVNEDWLRSGNGDPFIKQERSNTLEVLKYEYELDDFQFEMIKQILNLSTPQKNAIVDYLFSLVPAAEKLKLQDEVSKKIGNTTIIRVPARGGYYDIEDTEERRAAIKRDLERGYEYNPDDF